MKATVFVSMVCAVLGIAVFPVAMAQDGAPPRLIVQITVDALRSDLPKRYAHVLGEGGFGYLMNKGVV